MCAYAYFFYLLWQPNVGICLCCIEGGNWCICAHMYAYVRICGSKFTFYLPFSSLLQKLRMNSRDPASYRLKRLCNKNTRYHS